MDLGIRDKVFAIVGGSRGMGAATAKSLAEEGAKVAIIARSPERAGWVASEIAAASGAEIRAFTANATVRGSVEAAIEAAVDAFGRLDGLAVTAGMHQTRKKLLDVTEEDWEDYFQSHLMTAIRSCKAAIPHLIAAGGGSIVTTASFSALAPKPVLIGYGTMKAAIASLTRNIALTHGKDNIRANCICPGFTLTEWAEPAAWAAAEKYGLEPIAAVNKAMVHDYKMNVAMERVGTAAELADLYAFLLSQRAFYLSGETITCDGATSTWALEEEAE